MVLMLHPWTEPASKFFFYETIEYRPSQEGLLLIYILSIPEMNHTALTEPISKWGACVYSIHDLKLIWKIFRFSTRFKSARPGESWKYKYASIYAAHGTVSKVTIKFIELPLTWICNVRFSKIFLLTSRSVWRV